MATAIAYDRLGRRCKPVTRRLDDDPEREKWCAGSCGRKLKVTEFSRNGHGYPTGQCRGCHRVTERERATKRYHSDAAYRARVSKRTKRRYAEDPERFKAEAAVRYWTKKMLAEEAAAGR